MSVNDPMMESKHHDPMLDGITRYDSDDYDVELPEKPDGIYVLFSDLLALIACVREEAAEAAMQIGRQIEKDNHAAGLCEPSYTHGREYQQQRLTNHDMHSGLACLTNYEQGQRDEREACAAYIAARGLPITAAAIRAREDERAQTSTSRPTPTGQRDVGPSVAPAGEDYGAHNAALTPWDMRVLVEMLQSARALVESEDFDGFALGRAVGRAEARDAVAALPATAWHCPDLTFAKAAKAEALAAIDALRGAE